LALALGGAAQAQSTAELGLRAITDRSQGNCLACHTVPGQTGLLSNFGPSLAGVGARYSADQLRQWVMDARVLKPDTLMPPFGTTAGTHLAVQARALLSAEQIEQVVAALQTLR
jgi:sulfur-oxidizing protein SoxX